MVLNGRTLGEAQQATSAALDHLLADLGITFDGWVVLSAVAADAVPAEVDLLVPALSAVLDTTEEMVQVMVDEAVSGNHVRVVPAPSGDSGQVRVELTTEGEVLHERVRAAIGQLALDLSARIPRHDLETAGRVLLQVTREARAWLDSAPAVTFSRRAPRLTSG
jgi:hypothetical protein